MKKGKKVAVLVARQGSTRLPGKGMMPIDGKPVVWHILNRLKLMNIYDEICLATSTQPEDRPLVELAESFGATAYAGDPEDVLDRFYQAAKLCNADAVAEIGGDCPFVDADVTQRAFSLLDSQSADYVSNVDPATFPDGMDIHVVRMPALEFAAKNAVLSSQRLHPLSYFHRHKRRFKIVNFENDLDLSSLRWTLDYAEDFALIKRVFEALNPVNPLFTMGDILALLEREPELKEINRKWVPEKSPGAIPAYWYNKTYTTDLLNDVRVLADLCGKFETEKNYERLQLHYGELLDIAEELKTRAEHFAQD